MNPWELTASDLMIWGLVAHLVADWTLQNEWMANNKASRRTSASSFLDRHPAAYVHAGIHGIFLSLVFGPLIGAILAVSHLIIDCRRIVARWSSFIRQTQPSGSGYDVGLEVRFWTDQVFHIVCIAMAAILVTL